MMKGPVRYDNDFGVVSGLKLFSVPKMEKVTVGTPGDNRYDYLDKHRYYYNYIDSFSESLDFRSIDINAEGRYLLTKGEFRFRQEREDFAKSSYHQMIWKVPK